MQRSGVIRRREFLKTGLWAAGAGLWLEALFQAPAHAEEPKPSAEADAIGVRELMKGLDGMSRVADRGHDPFAGGHNAAAVMASAFFCREQKLDEGTQKAILALVEARLLTSPIYAPRPEETADYDLVEGLVRDLHTGIDSLQASGHNIIFANLCLKALREVPEAATPARIGGLRRMVRSLATRKAGRLRLENQDTFVGLSDEARFVPFVLEEYLKALDLYLNGKGHHGFAGHLLTIGHSLLELRRAGYTTTADKGIEAFWQFVQQARNGADLGGRKIQDAPPRSPTPREPEYWVGQGRRQTGEIVSSHLIKYPYSLFALAQEVRDEALKQRVLDKLHHLTAVS